MTKTGDVDVKIQDICLCLSSGQKTVIEHELRNTYILSASFCFVFTAFLAIQNLQISLNQEAGLGMMSLSSIYGSIIFSSMLAPTVLKIIGGKSAIVIAWIFYIVYTLSNFYPTVWTLIPSSVLLGLMSGPLWTSQSVYITRNAYSLADKTGKSFHAVLSKLNGIFFAIYELTQIIGNIVSSVVLYKGMKDNTSSSSSEFCGAYDCPIFAGNITLIVEPESDVVCTLLGIFLIFGFIGLLLTLTFLPPLPKSQWSEATSFKTSVVSCVSTFCNVDMILLVPFIASIAVEQAVLLTDLTKSYISCPIGIQMVGFIMASYGGSTFVSTLVASRLVKYTGRHMLFAFTVIVKISIFIAIYIFKPTGIDDLPYLFIIAVVWGLAEGVWQTQLKALVGFLYPDNTEPAFANYHFWKATGLTIYFASSTVLCVQTKLIAVIVLLAVSAVLHVILEIKVHFKRRQETP